MVAAPQPVDAIDDRWARAIGIPTFGLLIPYFVGLFGDVRPHELAYWVGTVWFVGLAFVVWQGNRWLLFRQRERLDWFSKPAFKLIALVFACVFYTAPVTALWIGTWYALSPVDFDLDALRAVVLVNVICVLFVTHAYETVFLIKGRTQDSLALANLERAKAQAQLDALRRQVDPHFLFNSLNTMASLVESDPARAAAFNRALAHMCRYLLDDRPLVPVQEELEFVRSYALMLGIRFGAAVEIELPEAATTEVMLPPTALQSLVENAVKHTRFDPEQPLHIEVRIDDNGASVTNPLRPKAAAAASSGLGLANLDERCRLLLGRGIEVSRSDGMFRVHVPVGGGRT